MQTKKQLHQAPLLKRLIANSNKRISHSDWVQYVAESLNALLNSRQGMVQACHHYGLPDFNDLTHTPTHMVRALERSIVNAIEIYEPRLQQVKVSGAMDEELPDRMRFNISAVLKLGEEKYQVHYQSVMTPGGRVVVKS